MATGLAYPDASGRSDCFLKLCEAIEGMPAILWRLTHAAVFCARPAVREYAIHTIHTNRINFNIHMGSTKR